MSDYDKIKDSYYKSKARAFLDTIMPCIKKSVEADKSTDTIDDNLEYVVIAAQAKLAQINEAKKK